MLLASAFRAAARAAASAEPAGADPGTGHDAATAKVLRAFVRDGRLVALPTGLARKRAVLDVVCQGFEPGERYSEAEVNRRLRPWHDDVASLRRWLVDLGYLDRDHGQYWRCGGPVPASPPSRRGRLPVEPEALGVALLGVGDDAVPGEGDGGDGGDEEQEVSGTAHDGPQR